jgi:plastocyanin
MTPSAAASSRSLVCGAILVLALGAAGCGGPGAAAAADPPKTHTITIEGMRFVPEALTIDAGDTVRWVNDDFVPHTATREDVFDSRVLPPGGAWTHMFGSAGEHVYTCTLHPTMKGTLRIRASR